MYRIDNATAVGVMPTVGAVGPVVNGFFSKGNPNTAQDATVVDDDWLNSIQEEVCFLIEQSGINLDKTNPHQMYAAIQTLIQGTPRGTSSSVANTYLSNLSPAPSSYTAGMVFTVLFTNGNTGAATINLNNLGAKDIKRLDGSALISGDLYDGMTGLFTYDGTNMVLLNVNQQRLPYASSTSSPNTYVAGLSIPIKSYNTGMTFAVKFTNANTGAMTLNLNSVGAVAVKKAGSTALIGGEIKAGMVGLFTYDGTYFQLLNPASTTAGITIQAFSSGTGTYTTPAGCTRIKVRGWAGGGGGGGVASVSGQSGGGGGGGGGGYFEKTIYNPSPTYSYGVGAGGTAGPASSPRVGGNGGDTTFDTCTAHGGGGGVGGGTSNVGNTSAGGVAGGSATGGDLNLDGQPGAWGLTMSAAFALSGMGGSGAQGGGGGMSKGNQGAGVDGTALGGGGSGGCSISNGGTAAGGSGGSGYILVEEYYRD